MSKPLDNDDVVTTAFDNRTPVGHPTFKVGQLLKAFQVLVVKNINYDWFANGLECELLSRAGGGWKKGKLYLRLEFVPDEPDPPDSSALVLSPKSSQP